jgi:hypothetical protein
VKLDVKEEMHRHLRAVSFPRFKPGTFQISARSINASANLLSVQMIILHALMALCSGTGSVLLTKCIKII